MSAIHIEAEKLLPDMVYFLLSCGVDVNQKSPSGKTALHYAVRYEQQFEEGWKRQKTLVKVLKRFGASHDESAADSRGHVPLFNAILTEDTDLIKLLIDDSPINHPDIDGDTHLHIAAEIGSAKVALLLIEKGADPLLLNHDGQTPSHIAAQKSCACLREMNEACEEKGLELISTFFQEDSSGNTPLDCAALHYQEETFRYIWNCLCKEPSPSAASYRGVLARLSSTAEEDNSFGNLQYALKSIPKSV